MPAHTQSAIHIVDLSAFTQTTSDSARREEAAAALIQACHEQGCVGIAGHGFSQERLEQLFQTSKTLFNMSLEDKMKAPHPLNTYIPHRGYTGVGGEKCFTKEEMHEHSEDTDFWKTKISVTDHKESFEVGSEDNKVHYNIWYPEDTFPGFRSLTLKAYWDLHRICIQILDAFMLGLHLNEEEQDLIRSIHSGLGDQLRLLHYPPLPAVVTKDPSSGRMQPHTDWSTFTLLFQDSCGGLEFGDRNNDGKFIHATPQDGIVYLNVGDMLTRMSNDYLPSALHRVVIPKQRVQDDDGNLMTQRRYSIPFFFSADDDKKIASPESVIAAHGPQKYEPVTLKEYSELRAKWLFKKQ